LRRAARGHLFWGPARPLQVIEVLGGYLHGKVIDVVGVPAF
jgi:hypothetical protein